MKESLKQLISYQGVLSHKRISSLIALICLVVALTANICGKIIDSNLLWIFASFVLGQSGLTTVEKFKNDVGKVRD